MQPVNKLATVALDLSSHRETECIERSLIDDMVCMVRDLVRTSKGRIYEVKLIVRDKRYNLQLGRINHHPSWRLGVKNPNHRKVTAKRLMVWTWEGEGKEIAEAIQRTDLEDEPALLSWIGLF